MNNRRAQPTLKRNLLSVALSLCLGGGMNAHANSPGVVQGKVSEAPARIQLTAEQIDQLPVQRDLTAMALLAPGTVPGDAAFGNLASFGGSSVAENVYYVNGFNITNPYKNLAFSQVPFEALSSVAVTTAGSDAAHGRATGGTVATLIKRGNNRFAAGGSLYLSPDSLRGTSRDVVANNGAIVSDNSRDQAGTDATAAVWASGAFIPDRLFIYALAQYGRTTGGEDFGSIGSARNRSESAKSPDWLVKLDWNITDNALLELTSFSDTSKSEADVYLTKAGSSGTGRGAYRGTVFGETGGLNNILKYTGFVTDNVTVSALYGHGEYHRNERGVTANGIAQRYAGDIASPGVGCPIIIDSRPGVATGVVPARSGCSITDGVLGSTAAKDERTQMRLDAEWQLGAHLLGFGIEQEDTRSRDGEGYEGGAQWTYLSNTLARKRVYATGARVDVDSRAFYLSDTWHVSDNLTLSAGLRWESFDYGNNLGQTYANVNNKLAPRLGLDWALGSKHQHHVFATAGRYALPLTTNYGSVFASPSLFNQQTFTYTGVDPVTGAPTGVTPSVVLLSIGDANGVQRKVNAFASENLEAMYQDEYVLGFRTELNANVSAGVRGIYRDLKRAIDDTCDYRPIYAYAAANGLAYNPGNSGFVSCRLFNPGSDGIFNVDVDGNGTLERIVVPADSIGPKAKRTYQAVELFADGAWGRGFFHASYTWSRSRGNTEGGVKSDIGQTDTGITQDFDYPELAIGSDGYLPNDRRHNIKAFGSYSLTDEWSIGANFSARSGRPINCFGTLGGSFTSFYGNDYFSCDAGAPTFTSDGAGDNGRTIVPRGSAGRTAWVYSLDVGVTWKPRFADGKLAFKADVFNLLDADAEIAVSEDGENDAGFPVPNTYRSPTAFQTPRSVRLAIRYDY